MSIQPSEMLSPVLYIPHGGGPLPILGDKGHEKMVSFLKEIVNRLGQPVGDFSDQCTLGRRASNYHEQQLS